MTEQDIHIEKIRIQMEAAGADACLITSNANLFYAVGQVVMGYLYISRQHEPLLFVRRPVGLSGERVIYVRKPEEIAEILTKRGLPHPATLMLEGDSITHSEWLRYENIFPDSKPINGTTAIRKARSVKTAREIELFRQSGKIHAEVYRHIPQLYRSGMTDVELSIEIERAMRLGGSYGIFRVFGQSMEIFVGSLLAGDNAAAPSPYDFGLGGQGQHPSLPVGANGTLLREGMAVMVDMGGNFTGYMTDMTRTFSIGKLPDKACFAHQTALEIQNEAVRMARPGAVCEDIWQRALDIAAERGLKDCFMGISQQAKFVGHGVGIEINELPVLGARSQMTLETGMMLAVEPKFVIEGVGAVGIENTFVVTEAGSEKITMLDDGIIDLTENR
ncbi:MAG: Xaa-Pro peptidase family protein [Bacteroidales bacterium]|jgi:Xaa-Pro aminopeptidase|nr:Xaa-Pro peptidase family protein [Bacteroidales bacterium]